MEESFKITLISSAELSYPKCYEASFTCIILSGATTALLARRDCMLNLPTNRHPELREHGRLAGLAHGIDLARPSKPQT